LDNTVFTTFSDFYSQLTRFIEMLATALLSVSALTSALSPSKNSCIVRCAGARYRNDPYKARVTVYTPPKASSVCISPVKRAPLAALTEMAKSAADNSLFRAFQNENSTTAFMAAALSNTAAETAVTAAPVVAEAAATAAAFSSAAKPRFALIKFKHESCMYQAPFRVSVGDTVFVEADRGEHLGTVEQIASVVPKFNVPSKIIRHATAADHENLARQRLREENTTATVQKLAESFGLGIRIVDTEFQTDGNKLTVYFASKVFVDFRKLQRSLFRDYRCRIWLVNWNEVRHGQTQLL